MTHNQTYIFSMLSTLLPLTLISLSDGLKECGKALKIRPITPAHPCLGKSPDWFMSSCSQIDLVSRLKMEGGLLVKA